MFNTWKYDPETDEVLSVHRAFDPITARSSQHQACDRCHNKKLKCTGDKAGCERCLSANKRCEYTRTGSTSRRSKKSGSSSRPEESSHSSSSSRRRDEHSGHHRSSGGSSSRSRQADQDAMTGTMDPYLQVDDGFGLGGYSDHQSAAMGGYSSHGYSQPQGYHQSSSASYGSWQGYPASSSSASGGYLSTSGQQYQDESYADYQMYGSDPRYWPHGR